jgi:hypothetical protein
MSNQAFYVFASIFAILNLLQSVLIARSLLTCRNKVNSTFNGVGSASGSTGSSSVEPVVVASRYNFLPSFALKWIPSKLRSSSSPTPLIPGQMMGVGSNSVNSNGNLCSVNNHPQNSAFCTPIQVIVPSAPSQQSVYIYSLDAAQLPNVHNRNRISTASSQHPLLSTQQLQQLQSMHHLQAHSLMNGNGSVTMAHPSVRTMNGMRVAQQTLPQRVHRASYPPPDHPPPAPSQMTGFQQTSHSFSSPHQQLQQQQEYEELHGPFDTDPLSKGAFAYGTLPLGASAANASRSFKVSSANHNIGPMPDISLQSSVNAKRPTRPAKDVDHEMKSTDYQRDEDMYLYESVDSPQHCFYDTRYDIFSKNWLFL